MPVPVIAAGAAAVAARLAAKKLAQAAAKKAATKAVAVSSRNAKKAAATRAALKSAKSKPPLATPKSNVKVLKPVLNSGVRNANEQGRIADMKYAADHARALAEKRVAALKLTKKSKVIKIK